MSEKQTEIDYSLIVKRIPVIINKPVKKSICLLKFHLRNNDRPYLSEKNIFKLESVKIKKKSLKLEICLNTNTEIQHFNPENSFPRDKLILVSRNIPNRPNYALFNVINGKMVLTPVKHIFMMSPDFSYINELAKNEKLEKSAKSNKKSEENLKMITIVQKLRRDNKTSNMAKFVAFKDNLNASQQEKFVTLTETKPNLINQLLEKESFAIQKMVKNSNFVDIIRNESNKKKNIVPKNPNFVRKNLSKFYIQSNALNLENKIIAILKNRGTSTLMEISKILKIEENDEKKVKQLQSLLFKNAFYLHGVWVARSKLIYGDIQKRCRFARDLLIAMFGYSPDGSIYKSNWDLVANLKDDKSLAILSEISKFDSLNKKWTLKNLGGFIDFEFVEQQKYLLSKLYVISKRVLAGKGSENDELDLHFADFLSAEFKSAQVYIVIDNIIC
ncbi:hypothetical protein MHBO_002559 [Bonamia ostreae]|uniref:DNA-directed RNA polymerase III subunit RPC5 n=1 Tax=Bonamia ostreae TaxID=126728 RepID=A0ABV2AMR4_9EUKA